MEILKKIEEDLQQAMRDKDELVVSVLRLAMAEIKNREIEKRPKKETLTEEDVLGVIKSMMKKWGESLEDFQRGQRDDLAQKTKAEMAILEKYLPAAMGTAELQQIIDAKIQESGATGSKDFGRVMKEVMTATAGRSDGSAAAKMLRESLDKLQN